MKRPKCPKCGKANRVMKFYSYADGNWWCDTCHFKFKTDMELVNGAYVYNKVKGERNG